MPTRRIKIKRGGKDATLPIKNPKQIRALLNYFLVKRETAKNESKKYLADRNYMICLVGLNTALRAEDLLQLQGKDLNGYVHIKENKTGKMQNFKMNKYFAAEVKEYRTRWKIADNAYLFMGQKKVHTYNGQKYKCVYPITRQQGLNIMKEAGEALGLKCFGLHSLRKTFGYQYLLNKGNPETLMKMYNHDDYSYTMRYTCWSTDDAENDRTAMYIGIKKIGLESQKRHKK